MTALYFLAFLCMAAGVLVLLNLSPLSLLAALPGLLPHRKEKMKEKIKQSIHPKKLRGIKKIVAEARTILKVTNQGGRFASLCALALALSIAGVFLGSLLGNVFLAPVLGVGFALLPFLYILLASFGYKKRLNGELETSLSVVTAEYVRTEDIVSAIRESLDSCRSPVRDAFRDFIGQVTSVNANVELALGKIRNEIDSDVWREWIDAAIACQQNRTLKSTLQPIVRKLSDMRIVSSDLNVDMYAPFRDWTIMGGLLLSLPLLIRLLSMDWYHILMYTTGGHIILAVDAVVFFFSLIRVIRLTRPVEYRR